MKPSKILNSIFAVWWGMVLMMSVFLWVRGYIVSDQTTIKMPPGTIVSAATAPGGIRIWMLSEKVTEMDWSAENEPAEGKTVWWPRYSSGQVGATGVKMSDMELPWWMVVVFAGLLGAWRGRRAWRAWHVRNETSS